MVDPHISSLLPHSGQKWNSVFLKLEFTHLLYKIILPCIFFLCITCKTFSRNMVSVELIYIFVVFCNMSLFFYVVFCYSFTFLYSARLSVAGVVELRISNFML